jgi:hypothetical protein
MNIERPTSNVEWKKMKKQMKLNCGATRGAHAAQALALWERRRCASDIIIRCSTLDVRCWTFIFQNNPVGHKCNL